jgi:MATE family multidrug resistance protein
MDFRIYESQYKPIISLGIPMVVGQIGTIILSFADTIMIGHHSVTELAAAAFVGQIFMLGILVAMGFSYGITPLVGNSYGRNNFGEIGDILRNALFSNTGVAIFLMFVYGVLYFFLDKMGQPKEIIPLMRPYYIVNWLSIPFVCWFNVFKQTADGTTDTRTPMWILLSGNVINIFGNWLLIYGACGMPELGLLGAGVATLLSRIFMCVTIIAVFFFTRRYSHIKEAFLKAKITKTAQLRINRICWPLAMQMGMESGAWSLASIIVGWIGASELAGHQIMLSVSNLFFQVYYAIAAAVSIRISMFNGTRQYEKIVPTAWAGFHLSMITAFIVAVPVFLLRNQIGWLFSDSAEVSAIVATVIIPLIVYQVPDGLQCVFSNSLRGLSNVKPLVLVAFLSYFVTSLPLSYLFGITLKGGLLGVWCSFPIGLSVAGALYYYFFKRALKVTQENALAVR